MLAGSGALVVVIVVAVVVWVQHGRSATPPPLAAGLVRVYAGGQHGTPPPPAFLSTGHTLTADQISGKGRSATARLSLQVGTALYGPFSLVVGQRLSQSGVTLKVVHIWTEPHYWNSAVDVAVVTS